MSQYDLFVEANQALSQRLGNDWTCQQVLDQDHSFLYVTDNLIPTVRIWKEFSMSNGYVKVNCLHEGAKLEFVGSGTPESVAYSLYKMDMFASQYVKCSDLGEAIQMFLNIPAQPTPVCVANVPAMMQAPAQYNSTGKRKADCLNE